MANPSQEEFLRPGGESHPALKFGAIGDTYRGIIIEEPQPIERPSLNNPAIMETQLPINLMIDGQPHTLWVNKGLMSAAIGDACKEAGVTGLSEGGELAVKFTGERSTGKPNPAKEYKAKYTPPAPQGVDVDDVF